MSRLEMLAKFLKESGMRKVSTGLYIYSLNAGLLYLKVMTGEEFKSLGMVVVLALMGANAYEHKKKAEAKNDTPQAA